jgi:dTDP-4-amino-4,6-dideoxygalactose transaminase
MARLPLFDLTRDWPHLRDAALAAFERVAVTGAFSLGDELAAFEAEWAAYCGTAGAVGVSSGTAAIELALRALGAGPGREVVTVAHTFVATVEAIGATGATPVLVDIDPATRCIDAGAAVTAAAASSAVAAIVPVHLYGQPADVAPLRELCDREGLALVEDAAQAHGARYRGRRVGGLGRAGCFSFYPGKNLGAFGDAGAVVTDDPDLAERLRQLRDLGQARKYEHVLPGHNERLDTIQAAVLRVKLRRLDAWNEQRRAAAAAYADALGDLVLLPVTAPEREHVWHLYVVRSPKRDRLREELDRAGIATGLHYPRPVHLQPAFAPLGHREGDFPAAEAWSRDGLSLPMFPGLGEDEARAVASVIDRT